MMTSLDDVKQMLVDVAAKVNSSSRLTQAELRSALAEIYSIPLDTIDKKQLLDFVVEHRKSEGANRAFLLRGDNPYTLPLRFVFPCQNDRTNVSRYAGALNELKKSGVAPEQFQDALKKRGGIVDLYWDGRNRNSKFQVRCKLTLNKNIKVESGKPVTITFLPQANGIFEVLDMPISEQH